LPPRILLFGRSAGEETAILGPRRRCGIVGGREHRAGAARPRHVWGWRTGVTSAPQLQTRASASLIYLNGFDLHQLGGAQVRLADEYDAAQERGETSGQPRKSNIPDGNNTPTVTDIGSKSNRCMRHASSAVALASFVCLIVGRARLEKRPRRRWGLRIPRVGAAQPVCGGRGLRRHTLKERQASGFDLPQ
jgi:hypothetical protein